MLDLSVPLVLASQSPRRRELLRRLGLTFEVDPSEVEERSGDGLVPQQLVEDLARTKAEAVARRHPESLVLGADTVVVLDEAILNKPKSPDEAATMLGRLSGRTHRVFSGIALLHADSGRTHVAHEITAVTFGLLTKTEIASYVATGSPLDKAGAYGIQDDAGAVFIEGIEGDYYNVVGLPLRRLYLVLREHFPDLLDHRSQAAAQSAR